MYLLTLLIISVLSVVCKMEPYDEVEEVGDRECDERVVDVGEIPSLDDMNDTNPLKTMMDTMAKHGANVELKRKMPDGTYQTASEGTMRALGAQARMSSTAQVLDTMTKEEKDMWAIEMRKMANELYNEKKYDEALGRYMEALTASDLGTAADSQSNIDTVIVPLLCNMSACCVQMKV